MNLRCSGRMRLLIHAMVIRTASLAILDRVPTHLIFRHLSPSSPALMEAGLLDRRDSLDLLQDLDFGIMDLGTSADQRECNDIIDIIGRKDTTGGDEGHGGGASGGNSGDGAAAAGTGSNGGGGNAEASTPEGDGALDLSVTSDGLLLDRNAFALHYDGKVLALGDEAGLGIKRGDDSGKNGGGGAGEGGGSKGCDNAGPRNGSGCASGQGGTGVAGGGGGAAGGVSAGAGGSGDSDREIDVSRRFSRDNGQRPNLTRVLGRRGCGDSIACHYSSAELFHLEMCSGSKA